MKSILCPHCGEVFQNWSLEPVIKHDDCGGRISLEGNKIKPIGDYSVPGVKVA